MLFENSNENIAVERKGHLGTIVGSDGCKREYFDGLVKDWNTQVSMLSAVAESQPQAAYSAFVSGFNYKHGDIMLNRSNNSMLVCLKIYRNRQVFDLIRTSEI